MSNYSQFGVSPIVNAAGTLTRLGGAIMPDAVVEAMRQASRDSVSMESLQAAASKVIARVTGTESGIVTCGASSALTLGTAAILCRDDVSRMNRLPDTTGIANEFVIARDQRNGYDHAVRAAGAKLVEVGINEVVSGAGVRGVEIQDYEEAIGPATAGILYVHRIGGRPTLREVVAMAHKQAIPVLVDAAAELPPKRNLRDIPGTGADLVAFSGGKAIRGPQNTGILCGDAWLIRSAALQMLDMDEHPALWNPPSNLIDAKLAPTPPRHGIGRGFKVAKEQIVGLLVALELFANGQYEEAREKQLGRLEGIAMELRKRDITCKLIASEDKERSPTLVVSVGVTQDAFEVCRELRMGEPPMYVYHGELDAGRLVIDLSCAREDQDGLITRRLCEELGRRA